MTASMARGVELGGLFVRLGHSRSARVAGEMALAGSLKGRLAETSTFCVAAKNWCLSPLVTSLRSRLERQGAAV